MRRIKSFLRAAGIILIMLAISGYAFDRIATARDREHYPPNGQLVDVGGYRIHLYCSGSGRPTVVLDAGGFDSLEQWRLVQPEVAKLTRTCSYDRAGFGWSDASPHPQTARQIAHELHTALANAGITGPYIVVGHSISGLYARVFASEFPGEVAGMVLDDSVHPKEFEQFPSHFPHHPVIFTVLRMTAPLGLPRLLHFCKQSAARPDCSRFVGTLLGELDDVKTSYQQAATLGPLRDMPLSVLAHDPAVGLDKKHPDADLERAWSDWQQDLSRLSTRSSLLVVKGCSHEIQTERPEVVAAAILSVLEKTR